MSVVAVTVAVALQAREQVKSPSPTTRTRRPASEGPPARAEAARRRPAAAIARGSIGGLLGTTLERLYQNAEIWLTL